MAANAVEKDVPATGGQLANCPILLGVRETEIHGQL